MITVETPKGRYEINTDDRKLAISHVRKHMGLDLTKWQPIKPIEEVTENKLSELSELEEDILEIRK